MPKVAEKVRLVGTVLRPTNTVNPHPRQYFDIGRQFGEKERQLLEDRLREACKHVSSVVNSAINPHNGEPSSFYVSYGGLDPTPGCKNTQRRLEQYGGDVLRIITNLVAQTT